MTIRTLGLLLAAAGLAASIPAVAQSPAAKPLEVEVLQTSAGSLFANIALVKGEKDAVLVDAPFTMADAHRVVAMVLDSGKRLTTVFVTHDHPDHFFAMEVIADAFPDARIVADPVVVADIWKSLPAKVKRWGAVLGANGPRHPSAPSPLDGDTILLEGRPLKVIGPMPGDHVHATALWVPSIGALIAGDLVFNDVHLWLGEQSPADIAAWGRSIDTLAALKPRIVVAGHSRPGTANDASGLAFTKRYIAAWPGFAAASKTSAEMAGKVTAAFPGTIDVLGDFLLGNSTRVAKGEQPRWQE